MNYKKYSDEEILESYSTALDYSGKADKDLVAEIDRRGGINQLKTNVGNKNIIPYEVRRINELVFALYKKDQDPYKIKSLIKSDILPSEELNNTVDIAIRNIEQHVKDTSINSGTVTGSVLGILISSSIGAGLWCYSIIQTGEMYYMLSAGILIISYIIIRLLTKQSSNNTLVFISTFASTAIAMVLGLWFFNLLTS